MSTGPALFGQHNKPGFRSEVDATTRAIFFTEHYGEMSLASRPYLLASTTVDAGNTPTTLIRGGHVLALDSNGELTIPTNSNNPVIAILASDVNMLTDGVAADQWIRPFVKGNVRYNELLNINPLYARELAQRGFVFDEPHFNATGAATSQELITGDKVLTIADNGKHLIVGDTATVTLPDASAAILGMYVFVTKATGNVVTVDCATNSLHLLPTGSAGNSDTVDGGTVRFEVVRTGAATYLWAQG